MGKIPSTVAKPMFRMKYKMVFQIGRVSGHSSMASRTRAKKLSLDVVLGSHRRYKPRMVLLRASFAAIFPAESASAVGPAAELKMVNVSSGILDCGDCGDGEASETEVEGGSSSCKGGESGRVGRAASLRERELGDGGTRGL